jgi:short-subunit dehydrogenase involved in D-alanine esterification of teichoic acids
MHPIYSNKTNKVLSTHAIEYDAGRNFSLDHIIENLKKDPKRLNPKRKNLDKDSTDFEKPKSLNRRIKKIKQEFDNKNVLVINANIITNQRLFQKERFRPETLSEEEKETLEKGKYASSLDVTIKVIEHMKKTDPEWEKKTPW